MNNKPISKAWAALVLSILLAFSSCGLPYCKKVPFSKNDIKWMSPYEIGDTIYFISEDTSEIDTIVVTNKTINNPSNTNIFNLKGCNWMEGDNEFKANAEYQFEVTHNQKHYNCMFILEKDHRDLPATVSFGFFGRYTKKGYSIRDAVDKLSQFPNYESNIVVSDSNLYSGKHQLVLPLSELYWNREVGLIGYKISNNLYRLYPN